MVQGWVILKGQRRLILFVANFFKAIIFIFILLLRLCQSFFFLLHTFSPAFLLVINRFKKKHCLRRRVISFCLGVDNKNLEEKFSCEHLKFENFPLPFSTNILERHKDLRSLQKYERLILKGQGGNKSFTILLILTWGLRYF